MIHGATRVAPEKAVFRPALSCLLEPGQPERHMATQRKSISKRIRFDVFKRAARLGIIRRVGYAPAKSSNCSIKPTWEAA